MALQHLRSSTANKRPTPAAMADGQIAINTEATSPGLFFKNASGSLVKVGPVHVGTTAPNASPASGGETGNTLGEQWLDTTGGTYVFKVWDGSAWRSETGTFVDVNGDTMTGALGIIAGSAASPGLFVSGDTNTGIYSPGADQLAISTGGSGRLFVDANGNVGVGGTPVVPLDVQTATATQRLYSTTGTNTAHIQFRNTGGIAYVGLDNSTGGAFGAAYALSLTHTGAYPITFVTNGSERLRITSAGLVGIGTSSASTILHAAGTVTAGANGVANGAFDIKRSSDGLSVAGLDIDTVNSVARLSTAYSFLSFRAEGSERMRVASTGVGIGTASPGSTLEIVSQDTNTSGLFVTADGASFGFEPNIYFRSRLTVGGSISTAARIRGHVESQNNSGLSFFTTASGSNTEKARIDSSGRLLVGTSSARDKFYNTTYTPQLQLEGVTQQQSMLSIVNSVAADGGSVLALGKQRSGTIGGNTILQNGDQIGDISFQGSDGSELVPAASIYAQVDGTPGANDMPGRLVFSTTADGASSPTERMRIKQNGIFHINTGGNPPSGSQSGLELHPDGYIFASVNGGAAAYFNRNTNDGIIVELRQDNAAEGSISVSGSTVSYNGAHLSRWSQLSGGAERIEILRGSVLSNINEMCEWGDEDNEQLNRMKVSDVEGDKNVSGVFQAWDDDDDTYTNDFYCAMTGDFIIRIGAGVTVQRGDLLMSAGDGTAKPQDDDIIRSKTIAKVTSTNVSCTYDDGSYCVPCVLMAC